MESQQDSIDIARLKRVALGLVSNSLSSWRAQTPLSTSKKRATWLNIDQEQDLPAQAANDLSFSQNSLPQDVLQAAIPEGAAEGSRVARAASSGSLQSSQRDSDRRRLVSASSLPSQTEQRSRDGHESRDMGSADRAPGDTQVVSQSVFDSIIRQHRDGEENDGIDFGTLQTLHEGDPGHVDLVSGFDDSTERNSEHLGLHDGTDENDGKPVGGSSPAVFQQVLFPESQRFVRNTPSSATKKQSDHDGNITPAARNPFLSDPTGAFGDSMISLSQVFKATQRPSSHLSDASIPEVIPEMPSPGMPIQNPWMPTGAVFSSSSPRHSASLSQRQSESQLGYLSMQSPVHRDEANGGVTAYSPTHASADDNQDDEDDKSSFVKRLRQGKDIDEDAIAQFAGKAPTESPTLSRSGKHGERHEASDAVSENEELPMFRKGSRDRRSSEEETEQEEDETEQEDNLEPQHAPPSREPSVANEEDKENHDAQCVSSSSGATSAHDRLFQALGLQGNSSHNAQPTKGLDISSRCTRNSGQADETVGPATSSQVNVRDSQQSAGERKEGGIEMAAGQSNGHFYQGTFQLDCSSLQQGRGAPSRARADPVHSFSPLPQSPSRRSNESPEWPRSIAQDHPTVRTHSASPCSHISATQHSKETPNPHDRLRENSSGSVSRMGQGPTLTTVVETPLHPPPTALVSSSAVIPETSQRLRQPSRSDESSDKKLGQRNGGLPPMFSVGNRPSLSQPSSPRRLSPMKAPEHQKILSSPSGRQRRVLTEIASDPSPEVGLSQTNLELDMFTADDREFNTLVGMEAGPSKKKRCRNIGFSTFVLDHMAPVGAHPTSPPIKSPDQNDSEIDVDEPDSENSVKKSSENSLHSHSEASRRESTIWDVEPSPAEHVYRNTGTRRNAEPSPSEKRLDVPRRSRRRESSGSVDVQRATTTDHAKTQEANDNVGSDQPEQSSATAQIAPGQVLALYKGDGYCYPATCIGKPIGMSGQQYLVKFGDTDDLFVVVPGLLKRLDLRIGDAVRVNAPDIPGTEHIVCGFGNKKQGSYGRTPMTDVFGHYSVKLRPKKRESLPGEEDPGNTVEVAISDLYMNKGLWNRLKGRDFVAGPEIATTPEIKSRVQTPSDISFLPSTPRSRASNHPKGIFSGMVFAISFGDNDNAKSRTTELVKENGGHVLRDGFDELFKYSDVLPMAAGPDSEYHDSTASNNDFRLTPFGESLGFACLIADKHSRRVKYMQALALNLPCLSVRWIEDCVVENQILEWDEYLLAAGESAFLYGTTKSRRLAPKPANTARLLDTITGRPKLLDGKSVLVVMGRGQAEERRKPYIFLTCALGPSKVERVHGLKSAQKLVDQAAKGSPEPRWQFIYVDDSEREAARDMLLGTRGRRSDNTLHVGKKRSRSGMIRETVDGSEKVRVVSNDSICQSLIQGRLLDI